MGKDCGLKMMTNEYLISLVDKKKKSKKDYMVLFANVIIEIYMAIVLL